MKEEKKITLEQLRASLEQAMNQSVNDEEWEILLYGWRHKIHKQKAYTAKGWLTLDDALSLQEYAGFQIVNQ